MSEKLTDEALAELLAKATRKPADGYVMMVDVLTVAALVREVQERRAEDARKAASVANFNKRLEEAKANGTAVYLGRGQWGIRHQRGEDDNHA